MQSAKFSALLQESLTRYRNRAVETAADFALTMILPAANRSHYLVDEPAERGASVGVESQGVLATARRLASMSVMSSPS